MVSDMWAFYICEVSAVTMKLSKLSFYFNHRGAGKPVYAHTASPARLLPANWLL